MLHNVMLLAPFRLGRLAGNVKDISTDPRSGRATDGVPDLVRLVGVIGARRRAFFDVRMFEGSCVVWQVWCVVCKFCRDWRCQMFHYNEDYFDPTDIDGKSNANGPLPNPTQHDSNKENVGNGVCNNCMNNNAAKRYHQRCVASLACVTCACQAQQRRAI